MTDWPALAFRPPTVRNRLRRGSRACPLALRDVVGGMVGEAFALPIVWAPSLAVARAALVAAKEAGSALGLVAPTEAPERWFDVVTAVADEIAPGLPLLLSAVVVLLPGPIDRARALRQAQRLVDAGMTHLVVDLDAVDPELRAEELARVAEPALERGLGVECLLPAGEGGLPAPEEAFSFLAELGTLGASPDLAGVRLARGGPGDAGFWRSIESLADATGGVPLALRGAPAARIARGLRPGLVRAVDDGGAAAAASGVDGAAERAEARAYAEAGSLVDAVRAEGSAAVVAAALQRSREE
ncbi:MAG TPA: hypothetical protein VMT17_04935 [Anaeromyxobacteraceae bacterium]|nr:hypothetical protein [Anaeromyxobacteraceae bacterium]